MPRYIRFLIQTYLFLLALLTVFRFIAAFLIWRNLAGSSWSDLFYAFFMGWRFDNIIMCASLVIPTIIFTLNQYVFRSQNLQKLAAWPVIILVPIIVLLQIIDLIYFEYYSVRITSVLLNWLDDLAFTAKMVKDEPAWLLGVVAMPIFMWGLTWPIRRFSEKNFWHPLLGKSRVVLPLFTLLLLGLYFLGIRGRLATKSPIREGTAYFSSNPTLNHLALNPTYTFFASWSRAHKNKQKHLQFMSTEEAWKNIQASHGYTSTPGKHPLSRALGNGEVKDWNVVLVIMEGMSAHYTHYRQSPSWTPSLDKLMQEGWQFKNAYSAGLHTFNGVWSTLFSFPSPYTSHPLKRDIIPVLNSFATQMTERQRETFFFTTHDDQFDNMAGFVRQNGYQRVIHQGDYPPERVFSILGVPDHDMFHFALPLFKEADGKGRFFAAMLTGSNHKPYVIPPELKTQFKASTEKENIVRYADWAIGDFIERAKKEPWGQRTIFAFIADHGQSVGTTPLDQIMSYNHVPFIIWSPRLSAKVFDQPVMQIDVLPTLLEVLGGSWQNNTLGQGALAQPRQWAYVGRDASTCLITHNEIDCETQDKHHDIHTFPASLWTAEVDKVQAWQVIHAELQISDTLLRELPSFP